MTRELLIILKS